MQLVPVDPNHVFQYFKGNIYLSLIEQNSLINYIICLEIINYIFRSQNRIFSNISGIIRKRLAVLDFDHTVVEDNTDIVARNLVTADKIPETVTNLYKRSGWIPYMQEIFHILYANNFRLEDIKNAIEAIPPVNGFVDLIRQLHDEHNFDVIIISDSNLKFIQMWNRRNHFDKYVREIFTNPAHFDVDGRLLVQPYHHQINCKLSSENLCKGDVMESYVSKTVTTEYESIFYFGDGQNDLCPVLRLGRQDFGCVRRGFQLEKAIQRLTENGDGEHANRLDANILYWTDGVDLLESILKRLKEN